MRVAIMQPYFLPYIGYYQLIAAVDAFVIYDNIKYTKKGWINRNRMFLNGADVTFSLPLRKDSDSLTIVQRELSTTYDRTKLLNQFKGAYVRAPYFNQIYPLLERIVSFKDNNLFRFILHSIVETCAHIDIGTDIYVSSEIDIDHNLKSQDKVLALCKAIGANTYINAIGGTELYSKYDFEKCGIELKFIKAMPFEYSQFGAVFIPWLSIVDVLMFSPLETVRACVTNNFELV